MNWKELSNFTKRKILIEAHNSDIINEQRSLTPALVEYYKEIQNSPDILGFRTLTLTKYKTLPNDTTPNK
jgi:hypothetical protein